MFGGFFSENGKERAGGQNVATLGIFKIDIIPKFSIFVFFSLILFSQFYFTIPDDKGETFFGYEEWRGMKDKINISFLFDSFSELHRELNLTMYGRRQNSTEKLVIPTMYSLSAVRLKNGTEINDTLPFKLDSKNCFIFEVNETSSSIISINRFKLNSTFDVLKLRLVVQAGLDPNFEGIYLCWSSKGFPVEKFVYRMQKAVPAAAAYFIISYLIGFKHVVELFTQIHCIIISVLVVLSSYPFKLRGIMEETIQIKQVIVIHVLSNFIRYFVTMQLLLVAEKKHEPGIIENIVIFVYFVLLTITQLMCIFNTEAEQLTNLPQACNFMNITFFVFTAVVIIYALDKCKQFSKRFVVSIMLLVLLSVICFKKQTYQDLVHVLDSPLYHILTFGVLQIILACFLLCGFQINPAKIAFITQKKDDEKPVIFPPTREDEELLFTK